MLHKALVENDVYVLAYRQLRACQLIPTIVPLLTLMISSSSDEFIKYCIDSLIYEITFYVKDIDVSGVNIPK